MKRATEPATAVRVTQPGPESRSDAEWQRPRARTYKILGVNSHLLTAGVIALMPFGALRRLLYRWLMGFEIPSSSRIGFLTVMAIPKATIGENVRIGPLNVFKGPFELTVGARSRIGRRNLFTSPWLILEDRFAHMRYTPKLEFGEETLVVNDHFFDVFGLISIGDGTWIAGYGSQFWTHGLSVTDRDIIIGRRNYIGSAVRFAPGTSIGNDNVVALGSVLLSKLDVNRSLISGFPAKPVRSIAEDQANGKYRFSFEDW